MAIGFKFLDKFGLVGLIKHPIGTFASIIMIVVILYLYTKMAAEMAILLCKAYFFISLNGFFFALASLDVLRDTANNYMKAMLGLGLQIMSFYILMGVGAKMGVQWEHYLDDSKIGILNLKPFVIITIATSFFYLLIMNIPPFMASLVGFQGFRNQGYGGIESMITAGAVIASSAQKTAQGAGGFTRGTGQAVEMVKQMGSIAGAGSLSKTAARYVAGSLGNAMKDGVMKQNTSMTFGQKANAHMASKVASHTAPPTNDFSSNQITE